MTGSYMIAILFICFFAFCLILHIHYQVKEEYNLIVEHNLRVKINKIKNKVNYYEQFGLKETLFLIYQINTYKDMYVRMLHYYGARIANRW